MEQKIEGEDVYGDPWRAATPRPREADKGACARIDVLNQNEMAASMLDDRSAAKLGAFLLSAAGVKLVETMREAVAANDAAERLDLPYANGKRRDAIDALAAELAKLDALTGDK